MKYTWCGFVFLSVAEAYSWFTSNQWLNIDAALIWFILGLLISVPLIIYHDRQKANAEMEAKAPKWKIHDKKQNLLGYTNVGGK